jgi:TPR repeat protein
LPFIFSPSRVPQDYGQAYKWVSLSAALGNEDAAEVVDLFYSEMTSEQIAEAQALAADWWEDYQSGQ